MPPDAKVLKDLDTVVQAAITLAQQLQSALSAIQRDPSITLASSTENTTTVPLALARDSASLIRAHSTKLSLLLVNEPFTPNAIIKEIRSLTSKPLPCLAASLDACHPSLYTTAYRRELALRCMDILGETAQLLGKVPTDGKSLSSKTQGFSAGEKGSIALTGLLWAACDETINLADKGVGGYFVKKAEQWRDELKDVMEELKEWGDEEPDDEEEDDDDDDGQAGEADVDGIDNSAQDMLDDLMNSHRTISRSDPEKIRPRLETALKRLRLVTLLYQAIIKRRLKKLPTLLVVTDEHAADGQEKKKDAEKGDKTETVSQRLDQVAKLLARLPDRFGDLAGAFYELDTVEIDQAMDQCFLDAFAASELLARSWDGGRDEFTEWTEKFQVEIRKE
jgi:hypothetical protein